ncbi:MAG: phosphoribosylformylglycinamidine cyclo-ligase [Omnitrophica bacterium RBG_13_46_9]|nr:MAG: phosphoribosylformylglycinamidine cyclo-ligase [Omnitrophica bacterium RBG_13_46_9]
MGKLSYKKSGVDIDKANIFVQRIKPLIRSTKRPGWVSNIGAFAGFFRPSMSAYKDPIIVASTDGVGTKLMIANWVGKHDTVGIDLVAMCVNDIVTCGAEPLFFLDYFATGKLSSKVAYEVLKGIVKGCRFANCSLIGGETAELPGMYRPGDYDLAGFSVGIVDRKGIIDGSKIRGGDLILGIASTGLHSNGYSLVRKVFSKKLLSTKLAEKALKPTMIYVKPVLDLLKRFDIKGIANITGGGFHDNIIRLLPLGVRAVIYNGTWPILPIFKLIKKKGLIEDSEMFKTFNMGIGMALILSRKEILKARDYLLKKYGLKSWVIGEIIGGRRKVEILGC